MKKFLFTLLMALPFLSYGQFTKGDKFIGGYLSRPEIGLHDLPCKQYEKIR